MTVQSISRVFTSHSTGRERRQKNIFSDGRQEHHSIGLGSIESIGGAKNLLLSAIRFFFLYLF